MKPLDVATTARNLLVGAGAYYLSWFVVGPLAIGFGKLTIDINRASDAGRIVLPIVTYLPVALTAAIVGASVVLVVESETPLRWSIFPAALYGIFGYVGSPMSIDRVTQAVGAIFLALACLSGALLAVGRQATRVLLG
jgi:hypothetical protein